MIETDPRQLPVEDRAVRLAWEQDATAAGLPARAAWMRWRVHRDDADPGHRIERVPARVPPEGEPA